MALLRGLKPSILVFVWCHLLRSVYCFTAGPGSSSHQLAFRLPSAMNMLLHRQTVCGLRNRHRLGALRAMEDGDSSGKQRSLPAIIVSKEEMMQPGQTRFLDFSDRSAKKALKRARKGGDQRKDGRVGKLAMVCLDDDALARRVMELETQGCEIEIISREKTSTQSIAGDSSLSFKVEVEATKAVTVSPKPQQLEPFVIASISDINE